MTLIIYMIIAALLVGIDQFSKFLAVEHLSDGPLIVWPEVFELKLVNPNKGIAFSFFEDLPPWVLVFVATALLTAIVVAVIRVKLPKAHWVRVAATLIVAGGLGNVIDRICHGAVIDFLYIKLIDFPVFNVADCFVCIGAFVLLIYVIFIYREPAKTDTNA